MNQPRRILYIGFGTIFFVLGAIGVFIPLLPTTPFWLLTCWFYLRSSERLYHRVMRNRYFGSYIRGYVEEKAIPLRSKVITVALIWSSTILTFFLLTGWAWIKSLLVLISVGVSWHILSYPSRRGEKG